MKGDKGQIFSSDFLIGITVLLFVLTALQVHHSNILRNINHQQKLLYRETLISRTDTLVMFPGSPENWNRNTVEVLGFSTGEPNHLNATKIDHFVDMDLEKIQRLLGLRGKDFYFVVENSTDNIIYSKGNKNWESADNVYSVEREVFLEGRDENVVMRLVVW